MRRDEFAIAQRNFAQRLRRLAELSRRASGDDSRIDDLLKMIGNTLDGTEVLSGLIVDRIRPDDRRLRENMVALNHVLADIPSELLFGTKYASDNQRLERYELVAALMVESGFPVELLANPLRFERYQFTPTSQFFGDRNITHLNEQLISCWARRLSSFYDEIANVIVPGRELRDNLAKGNAGMTTERLLQRELGVRL